MEDWETISTLLADEILKRKSNADPFFRPRKLRSNVDQRVYDIAKTSFESSDMFVTANKYLCNTFEADIVLKIPIANSMNHSLDNSVLIINIEVDGFYHHLQRKKRFHMLRDKYLTSQGVVLERIETSALRKTNDMQLNEWLLERVDVGQKHATSTMTKPIATIPTTAPISSLRRVPIVHTIDDKLAVDSSNTTHTGMKEGSGIQIVEEQTDIKLEKSSESQVMNPMTKRMIRIGGVTYNKLIRLWYTFTNYS
jgi:hypothetical protein